MEEELPTPPEYMSSYLILFRFRVDPFRFSVFSIGKLCLLMSLSIIVLSLSVYLWFSIMFFVPSDDI